MCIYLVTSLFAYYLQLGLQSRNIALSNCCSECIPAGKCREFRRKSGIYILSRETKKINEVDQIPKLCEFPGKHLGNFWNRRLSFVFDILRLAKVM